MSLPCTLGFRMKQADASKCLLQSGCWLAICLATVVVLLCGDRTQIAAAMQNQDDMKSMESKDDSPPQSHDELVASRKEEAEKLWKLAMSDLQPQRKAGRNFFIVGTPSERSLDELSKKSDAIAKSISKKLGTAKRDHFIVGNGTIFVVSRKYDFSEFGKMLLKRDFPRDLKAWWDSQSSIPYCIIYQSSDQSFDDIAVPLTRQLTALHVTDLAPGIPRWFADGVGFTIAAEIHRKNPIVKQWESAAVSAAESMKKIDDFLNSRMDENKAGLVSFLFVSQLKSDRQKFRKLIKGLFDGEAFDDAFTSVYGATAKEIFGKYQKKEWSADW